MKQPLRKKELSRKYYLHQRVKSTFNYSSDKKTVFVPDGTKVESMPVFKYIKELSAGYGYNIQYFIPLPF